MAPVSDRIIWVRTQPDLEGKYRLALEVDEDTSLFLDHEQAIAYADYLHRQIVFATFDARVYAQVRGFSNLPQAAALISDFRKKRTPSPSPVILRLVPGVNADGDPFLHVYLRDEAVGQWSLEDARSHAQAVLEGVHITELEDQYLDLLVKDVGIDESTARSAIEQLGT